MLLSSLTLEIVTYFVHFFNRTVQNFVNVQNRTTQANLLNLYKILIMIATSNGTEKKRSREMTVQTTINKIIKEEMQYG